VLTRGNSRSDLQQQQHVQHSRLFLLASPLSQPLKLQSASTPGGTVFGSLFTAVLLALRLDSLQAQPRQGRPPPPD